jgi:hypothetical protein
MLLGRWVPMSRRKLLSLYQVTLISTYQTTRRSFHSTALRTSEISHNSLILELNFLGKNVTLFMHYACTHMGKGKSCLYALLITTPLMRMVEWKYSSKHS